MTNIITISYVPSYVNGQQLINVAGVTQSFPTYSADGYVAVVNELLISATGSSYVEALNKVLIAASASNNGLMPLPNIRTH